MITVTEIEEIGKGKIDDIYGMARFPVKYRAIVFRPFKNEVMDAVVESVTHVCVPLGLVRACVCARMWSYMDLSLPSWMLLLLLLLCVCGCE